LFVAVLVAWQFAAAGSAQAAKAGALDTSFGVGGKVTTDFSGIGETDRANALVVQPDGKLVAAGTAAVQPSFDFALARYNPDGTLDTSFGVGGKVTTDFAGTGDTDEISALVLQLDGKLVAAGTAVVQPSFDFGLARYNPDGTLDTSFGIGGKVTTDFSGIGETDEANALVVQPDGKLVAAGTAVVQPSFDFALARYRR
jgi:uncharacterized delta-60 repeat protein